MDAVLVFIINVTYGTNAVAYINESQRLYHTYVVHTLAVSRDSWCKRIESQNLTQKKVRRLSASPHSAHYWTSIYYIGNFFPFSVCEFNNYYCNILSPEEFNRRAVSFEALNLRHAARGSSAHTHINSRMTLCRALHPVLIISCSLRIQDLLNGPVTRIQHIVIVCVHECWMWKCMFWCIQQVRNTEICAHLMSREPLFYVQPNYSSSLHIHREFFRSLARIVLMAVNTFYPRHS